MTKRGGIGNCLLVSCILAALPLAGQAAVQRDPRTMAEASQACEDSVAQSAMDKSVKFAAGLPEARTGPTDTRTRRSAVTPSSARPVFDWDFGDNSPHSKLASPTHTYAQPGLYVWTVVIKQGARGCTKSWVLALLASSEYALARTTIAVAQELLSGLKRDYRLEGLGTNLKGTPQYPIRLRFEGGANQDLSCQARNADFVIGDDRSIDRENGPGKPRALMSVAFDQMGVRLLAGHFTCVGTSKAQGSSMHFPFATVLDTGDAKFLPGSRCLVGGSEYVFDGEAWRKLGSKWADFADALQKRRNPDWLSELARTHRQPLVRMASIAALTSQTHLAEITLKGTRTEDRLEDNEARLAALERISDQEVLGGIVRSSSDEKIRLVAMRGIHERETLVRIFKESSPGSSLRAAALEKLDAGAVELIHDESLLANIAETAIRTAVGLAAVKQLNDPHTLSRLALALSDESVAVAAVERISDPQILWTTALKSKKSSVRKAAVQRITDEKLLADLAIKTDDAELGTVAVRAIRDRGLLESVAKQAPRAPVWLAASQSAAQAPVSALSLYDPATRVLAVPFVNGVNPGMKTSVERMDSLLKENLSASGWHFAADEQSCRSEVGSLNSALEAARRCGAQVALTGTATGPPDKSHGALKSVDFTIKAFDVLTGKMILEEKLSPPVSRNTIPEQQAQKEIKNFVKRLSADIKKKG